MWVTIKKQLINLNHISHIKWDERGDSLHLYLYPAKRHQHNDKFMFEWYIGEYNPKVTEEINDVSYEISNGTGSFKPIFKHQLANNLKKYPSHEKVGRKGRVKRADDKRLMDNKEHSMNPNAEFIGE